MSMFRQKELAEKSNYEARLRREQSQIIQKFFTIIVCGKSRASFPSRMMTAHADAHSHHRPKYLELKRECTASPLEEYSSPRRLGDFRFLFLTFSCSRREASSCRFPNRWSENGRVADSTGILWSRRPCLTPCRTTLNSIRLVASTALPFIIEKSLSAHLGLCGSESNCFGNSSNS